ncbi:MAG: sugar ABC transporter permease [Sphaerochaetaceae bacterium]|jgi:raffinose/stachyose/melibiose transport system permease protein
MQKALKRYFALFALPGLICFCLAFFIPMIMGIILSFCKFSNLTNAKFVGLSNYAKMFVDGNFGHAFGFTVLFTIVSMLTINVIAFALALLLTRGVKGTNVFRTIFFMPNLIGGIVLGWIWQVILNGILMKSGVTLVSDAKYGFWGLVILMNWQNVGYMMVIYIAGIQNISSDLIEAAQIDGAGKWVMLRHVIIPSVMPSITICTFLTLTNGFKLFDQNLALTAGDPGKKSEMLALNIYNTFYGRNGFEGVGQAKAVLFTVIVAVIALTQLRITRNREVES